MPVGAYWAVCASHIAASPPGRHEFGVTALLDEPSVVQDVDAVGVADAGHAVGDQDDGPVRGGEPADAVEGLDLRLRVERGGGLVHDEHAGGSAGGVAPVGPGEADLLPLAAGQFTRAPEHPGQNGAQAVGKPGDDRSGTGVVDGRPQVLGTGFPGRPIRMFNAAVTGRRRKSRVSGATRSMTAERSREARSASPHRTVPVRGSNRPDNTSRTQRDSSCNGFTFITSAPRLADPDRTAMTAVPATARLMRPLVVSQNMAPYVAAMARPDSAEATHSVTALPVAGRSCSASALSAIRA